MTATPGFSRFLAFGLGVLSLSLLRCAPEEVVVFEVPAGEPIAGSASGGVATGGTKSNAGSATGGGGTASGGSANPASGGAAGTSSGGTANGGRAAGMPCSDDVDCPDSRECQKNSCADATGQCEPRPVFCERGPKPVCGCDQITYWNDCVRRQGGAVAGTPGECRASALECASAADCGVEGASCPRLYYPPEEPCTAPPRERGGICWVVPLDCESGDPRRWNECLNSPSVPPPPPPGSPPLCADTCAALRSDGTYLLAPPAVCE